MSSLIRIYTVCHSACIFLMHYSIVKSHCSKFRIITAIFLCVPILFWFYINEDLSRLMTQPTKWYVRPAKTQISLGIWPVWSESSLCAQWVAKEPSFLHADSEDSDQTGRMPRLIWVFTGRPVILLVLSWGGSFFQYWQRTSLSSSWCRK